MDQNQKNGDCFFNPILTHSGTVGWKKVAALLHTAKLQQQFGQFQNGVNKIERNRFYMKESQKA